MQTFLRHAACLLIFAAAPALAQWVPTKPVRVIVPFPAGGIVDLMARTATDKLAAALGQPVIVDTRAGAQGSIGTEAAARAEADGHTLLMATLSHAALPAFGGLPWHPTRDFAGVALLGQVPNLVVVTTSLEPKTLKEFIDHARARPGKINFVNGGNGTSQTLGVMRLQKNTGIQLTSVGYKGYPPAVPDLISGLVQFAYAPFGVVAPQVRAGKLRAIAIAAPVRSKQFPDVPTMAEAGFGESLVTSWYAWLVPKQTPRPAVERLARELARIAADPEVVARMEAVGGSGLPAMAPANLDSWLAGEVDLWARFVAETGLKAE
ncbi:MAG: tripartite tricarboxylate transporter substrate binding protein [Burkholderiales bacterium]|nr:tripartite tricarboxylate transporter substrate binding protein [Burkholderiales bacterium]